ncbi:Uncharacterized protein HZ326_5215 [Fusarium oxysporum f. sp. albedinis]|nr:Uncharacterized protein HZ326_5215 [Fusarium oxysporum f. sp. albedinis]
MSLPNSYSNWIHDDKDMHGGSDASRISAERPFTAGPTMILFQAHCNFNCKLRVSPRISPSRSPVISQSIHMVAIGINRKGLASHTPFIPISFPLITITITTEKPYQSLNTPLLNICCVAVSLTPWL